MRRSPLGKRGPVVHFSPRREGDVARRRQAGKDTVAVRPPGPPTSLSFLTCAFDANRIQRGAFVLCVRGVPGRFHFSRVASSSSPFRPWQSCALLARRCVPLRAVAGVPLSSAAMMRVGSTTMAMLCVCRTSFSSRRWRFRRRLLAEAPCLRRDVVQLRRAAA